MPITWPPYTVQHRRTEFTVVQPRCHCVSRVYAFRETNGTIQALVEISKNFYLCHSHNLAMRAMLCDYALRWLQGNPCRDLWMLEAPHTVQGLERFLLEAQQRAEEANRRYLGPEFKLRARFALTAYLDGRVPWPTPT